MADLIIFRFNLPDKFSILTFEAFFFFADELPVWKIICSRLASKSSEDRNYKVRIMNGVLQQQRT